MASAPYPLLLATPSSLALERSTEEVGFRPLKVIGRPIDKGSVNTTQGQRWSIGSWRKPRPRKNNRIPHCRTGSAGNPKPGRGAVSCRTHRCSARCKHRPRTTKIPQEYLYCSRERLCVVEDLKGRYRNGRNK